MKLLKVDAGFEDPNYEESELDTSDFAELYGFDLVAYWYMRGSYEGYGQLVARKNGHWYHHDMSHCSCYGPVEHFDPLQTGYASLDLLLGVCSKEQGENIRPLVEAIRAYEKEETHGRG